MKVKSVCLPNYVKWVASDVIVSLQHGLLIQSAGRQWADGRGILCKCGLYVQVVHTLICRRNFCAFFGEDFAIHASAYQLDRGFPDKLSLFDTFSPQKSTSLMSWQQDVLEQILSEH